MHKGFGRFDLVRWAIAVLIAVGVIGGTFGALAQAGGDAVLAAADATKLLPASVYFKGQSATTQLRNSGGVKFADGFFVLSALVDTSGYSSDVQQKYQAYFIAEVPIKIEGHDLAAGIYGVGFIPDNKFVVLDVGAHDLFTVSSHKDEEMKRPMPLKVTAEAGGFRLYEGRNYITFAR
ncbi:hypothetical protein [Acidicapsa acidisoli]|uniref:hypothetical protein n=1 Tax=Acidicapsa acidisoli TaxID=1615681 RepID=UPI0021E0D436|nr:hypothetical protein [Acidicapsa acidisoli]